MNSDTVAISRATTNLTTPILDSYHDQEEVNFDPTASAASAVAVGPGGHSDRVPVPSTSTSATDRSPLTYDDAFPALPESDFSQSLGHGPPAVNSSATLSNNRMKVKSTNITSVYRLAPDNMRSNSELSRRPDTETTKIKEIMKITNTVIEKCSSRDGTLTFLITGKEDNVNSAKRLLGAEMETQIQAEIRIPKQHHKFVLGKAGQKLKELQSCTGAKITVPGKDDPSDAIRIVGTKAAIEKALHEIRVISSELASKNTEKLNVEKEYHPFVNGPFGETVKKIMNETGAKVNIPPLSVNSNEIIISGETNAVAQAKEQIMRLVAEKTRRCTVVHVEVKKQQHRYVIGPKGQILQEILKQTGVSIEVPPSDNPSETITLRGEQEKLGPALTLLYEKAHSEIDEEIAAPSWLQKYIIGPKGSHFQEISQDFHSTVNVSFLAAENKIRIHGPQKDVEKARQVLENEIRRISRDVVSSEMKVDAKYHKYLIGKSGQTINQIREKTGAQITIPTESEGTNTNVIRIEGNASAVESAKVELEAIIKKRMETDLLVSTQDLNIEQRFHKLIIGAKGENIREIRERFNQVVITFPVSEIKSDKVTVRGPREDVERCCKHLAQLNKELLANNYRIEVPIYKQFHKFLIGKDGANIKKIRDDTNTKIELPAEGSESEVIVISGKKQDVEKAKERVQAIQIELINVVQVDMIIPAKFHNSIIGARGRQIRQIMDDCGGVQIKFPQEGSGSDKVSIRGPRDCVTKAKQALFELSSEMQVNSFTEEIKARPEHHKFLIGKNGVNIKKLRDSTGAKVFFPSEKDEASDTIVITGKKESVLKAKKELESLIKELERIVEDEVIVDAKHHKHFVARRANLLRQISDEFGGVNISVPRHSDSNRVVLKGAKEFVSRAKQRILEEVERLNSLVTQELVIDQVHHRAIMGAKGNNVKAIQAHYNVQIKFPDRRSNEKTNGGDHITTDGQNGDATAHSDDASSEVSDVSSPRRQRKDVIVITGRPEDCEAAKVALTALIPVEVEVQVPYDYHRFIIGSKGKDVRELMDKFDVNIAVPHSSEHKDTIRLTGTKENTDAAANAITERVKQLDREKEDRELRSFKLEIHVDPALHPKIIGKKGTIINKIRSKHDVQIQFPERNASASSETDHTLITITGYESKAKAARDEILTLVGNIESLVTKPIRIDARVHPRLIGARGKNIRKIMDKFKVEIRFPRSGDADPNIVTIIGQEAEVDAAADHLLNLEEEYLEDEGTAYMPPVVKAASDGETKQVPGFIVKGAPWDNQARPDTTDKDEFPSMGGPNEVENGATSAPAWGPRQ